MSGLLTVTGLVKTFPGVRAVDGADLDVQEGEVHCLLGQNGAGKSTLIKVLSGAHSPDEGEINWRGSPASFASPLAALRAGLATIYQELDLVDGLSVAENIFLGHEHSAFGFSRRRASADAATALLSRLGHKEISPTRQVGSMSAAGKQIVSLARALSHDARLIIMDEPSAVLDSGEVDNLFRVIGQLTAQGVAVIYISHRLEEIRVVGDRVTVLKDGKTVASGLPAKSTPTADLVRLMTGRDAEYAFPARPAGQGTGRELLAVRDISRPGEFTGISFSVHPGEIVGLAGLVGSGRSEILETVYGARKPATGQILVDGRRLRPGSVRAAVRAGMGLCPEERKSQALLLYEAVYRNVSVSSLSRYARGGFVARSRELADVAKAIGELNVTPSDPRRAVRTLSGGNQQKVVLARWLLRDCRLLVLDEPTRGVDVGARGELYRLIRQLAGSGVGVLLVSSEIPEVLALADRVLVVRAGQVLHDGPAAQLTETAVLDMVMEGAAA